MSSGLNAVAKCCHELQSDKVTEQKRGLDRLISLLQNNDIAHALDANEGSKKETTWNSVFQVTVKYMQKEFQPFEDASPNVTPGFSAPKLRKLKDVFTGVKNIVRASSKASPSLKISDFLSYLTCLLCQSKFLSDFGSPTLHLITTDILSHRKYVCQISLRVLSDLLRFCEQDLTNDKSSRYAVVSELFCVLIKGLVSRSDPANHLDLFESFVRIMKHTTAEKSSSFIENVFQAMNLFIKWSSVTYRKQACDFGEECMDVALNLWMKCNLTGKSLDLLVEFCTLQIRLHHPNGNVCGSYVKKSSRWQGQILSLLSTIEMHLKKQENRFKFNLKVSKLVEFEQCFQLAAECCHILFQLYSGKAFHRPELRCEQNLNLITYRMDFSDPSTILSALGTEDQQPSSNVQRWLHIVRLYLQRYPDDFSSDITEKICLAVRRLLLNASNDEMCMDCFACISEVLACRAKQFPEHPMEKTSPLINVWKDSWNIASSYLTQAKKPKMLGSALDLLTQLIEFDRACYEDLLLYTGVMKHLPNIWSTLYMHIPPSNKSLRFALSFISSYGVISSLSNNSLFSNLLRTSANSDFSKSPAYNTLLQEESFRALLLHWLLGYKEECSANCSDFQKQAGDSKSSSSSDSLKSILINLLSIDQTKHMVNLSSPEQYDVIFLLLLLGSKSPLIGPKALGLKNTLTEHALQKLGPSLGISSFLWTDADFVALFKHFDPETCVPEVKQSNSDLASRGLTLRNTMLESILHVLECSMTITVKTILDFQHENGVDVFKSLCKSYFTMSNLYGRLFSTLHSLCHSKTEECVCLRPENFKVWLNSNAKVITLIAEYINNMCCEENLFENVEVMNLISIFLSEAADVYSTFRKFQDLKMTGSQESQEFFQPLEAIIQVVLSVLNSKLHQSQCMRRTSTEGDNSGDFESSISDSQFSMPSTSHGLKRKRYSQNTAATQAKLFENTSENITQCQCINTMKTLFCKCNPVINSCLQFLSLASKEFGHSLKFDEVITLLLKSLQKSGISNFSALQLFYNCLESYSSLCNLVTLEKMTEVMVMLKLIFRKYYQDHIICSHFLDIISKLILQCCEGDCKELLNLVMSETVELISIFWKLSLEGKCSPRLRSSILNCFTVVLSAKCKTDTEDNSNVTPDTDLKELDFSCIKDLGLGIFSFLTDSHDGIKFLCSDLLKNLFHTLSEKNPASASLQNFLLDCIFEFGARFLNKNQQVDEQKIEECVSLLSSLLHAICSCVSHCEASFEQCAFFKLCHLSAIFHRKLKSSHSSSLQLNLMLSCTRTMCMLAMKSGRNLEIPSGRLGSGLDRYAERHLHFIVKKWMENVGLKEFEHFPYFIFHCQSLQEMCSHYAEILFPLLFCHAESLNQLTLMIGKYFTNDSDGTNTEAKLRKLVLTSAAEIITVVLPSVSEAAEPKKSLSGQAKTTTGLLDGICKKQNAISYLVPKYFAEILINILMEFQATTRLQKNDDIRGLTSVLNFMCKLHQSRMKSSAANVSQLLLSDNRFLVQVLLYVRKHICDAHNISDLFRKLNGYRYFVCTLLGQDLARKDIGAYLIKDIIHLMAYYISFITKLVQKHRELEQQETLWQCFVICIDVLVHLCTCLSESSNTVALTCLNQCENSAALVNSISKLESCGESSVQVKNNTIHQIAAEVMSKSKKLFNILSQAKSLQLCADLEFLLMVRNGEFNVSLCSCMEIFQSVCQCLKCHDAHFKYDVILESLLKVMVKLIKKCNACKEKNAENDNIPMQPQEKILRLLLDLSAQDVVSKLHISECISQLCLLMPKAETGLSTEEKTSDDESKLKHDLLKKLSSYVVHHDFYFTKTLVQALSQFLQLPSFKHCWKNISRKDSLLTNVLDPFSCQAPHEDYASKVNIQQLESDAFLKDEKCLDFSQQYESWICNLTSQLAAHCSQDLFRILLPLFASDDSLCSFLLPHIFHDLLTNDPSGQYVIALSQYVQSFVAYWIHAINNGKQIDEKSINTVLNIIQFLRSRSKLNPNESERSSSRAKKMRLSDSKLTPWDNNFWLTFNYLDVAKLAAVCKNPAMAALYAEIWIDQTRDRRSAIKQEASSRRKDLASKVNATPESSKLLSEIGNDKKIQAKQILLQAFSMTGDIDSLYGLCHSELGSDDILAYIYEKEEKWSDALYLYNQEVKKLSGAGKVPAKIVKALDRSGLSHVSAMYRDGIQAHVVDSADAELCNSLHELQCEAAYKMSKWGNISEETSSLVSPKATSGFHKMVHSCLSALNDEDESTAMLLLESSKCFIVDAARKQFNPSCASNDNTFLANLFSLQEVSAVADLLFCNTEEKLDRLDMVVKTWEGHAYQSKSTFSENFECWDTVFTIRNCLISILEKKLKDNQSVRLLKQAEERNSEAHFKVLEEGKQVKIALQMLDTIQRSCSTSDLTDYRYSSTVLEEAKLLWLLGNKTQALALSEKICNETSKTAEGTNQVCYMFLLTKALQKRGEWLQESKMEGPTVIMQEYFRKSVQMAECLYKRNAELIQYSITKEEVAQLCVNGYKTLAKFADMQYRELIEYMQSNEFEQKRTLVREAKAEMKNAQSKAGPQSKYTALLQKNYELDVKDFNNILERKSKFLLSALEFYVKCLSSSDSNDRMIYRLCSLWFANAQLPSVPGLMDCACKQILSYKFVQLTYQLAARLKSDPNEVKFQACLQNLLLRMANDHPHHVLPVLLALANAHRDDELVLSGPGKRSKMQKSSKESSDRIVIAKSILEKVKTKKGDLVSLMENLSDAYVQLANYDAKKWAKTPGPINFEDALMIKKLFASPATAEKFSCVALPTVEIPLDKTLEYNNIVTLKYVKPFFILCGGINLPKVLKSVGSDGKEWKYLVKGRDDLRQDAVMMQVFKVVNSLLYENKDTNSCRMRTYRVVPLSQRSGLVEWCEGTMTIGTYLIGNPAQKNYGAHHCYRPSDMLSVECRQKLFSVAGQSLERKLTMYKNICQQFKPIFRHFFYEHFVEPSDWYDRRQAYSKSVATSSMVGYILGLGDRHVQNILVDCKTAELIHIDLGVAFEQGRCLPTPEMVPFRLTRDIVDGLGVFGVEGVFRRNCIRTLSILRESTETISTIVEVLLHDPLYDWMMTSGKALQLQRQSVGNNETEMTSVHNASTVADLLNDTVNVGAPNANRYSLAGRALLRVQEKLRGLECGTILSVEGQINFLVTQATDAEKLCALFSGWQPYL